MKTIFDLRKNQEDETISDIQKLFDEPLHVIKLGDQSISSCIGCWNCWLKTPGTCVMKDSMSESYSDYVNSDTVILLMSTAQGFIHHKAKAFLDRTIPHYHPYIELVEGECHHVARYDRYPDLVFYFENEGLSSQEEQVIEDYLYRTAFHFKSKASRIVKDDCLHLKSLESRKAKNRKLPFSSTNPMEKLVIYNGSPRRIVSNSSLILNKVIETLGDKVEVRDLRRNEKWEEWADAFNSDEHVMFLMPLYVHAMPSHVKAFIEKLQPSIGDLSFFVQSGFPESSQSHYLEAYFELLSIRLNRTYLGMAIKGGAESLQMSPEKYQEATIRPMVNTISTLMKDGKFSSADIQQLAIPVRFGKVMGVLFNLLAKAGVANHFLWDQRIKANNAFEKRFDRPYDTLSINKQKN
jgi:multimeric flavodoxin WrbA